jgi:hypothetical protein
MQMGQTLHLLKFVVMYFILKAIAQQVYYSFIHKKVTTFRSPYFIVINGPCCRAILSPLATRVVRKDIGMPFLCTRAVPVT